MPFGRPWRLPPGQRWRQRQATAVWKGGLGARWRAPRLRALVLVVVVVVVVMVVVVGVTVTVTVVMVTVIVALGAGLLV